MTRDSRKNPDKISDEHQVHLQSSGGRKRKSGRLAARDWADSNTAALQIGITPRQLRKLRAAGLFKLGTHYRLISPPGAGRPSYRWHINRCAEALEGSHRGEL